MISLSYAYFWSLSFALGHTGQSELERPHGGPTGEQFKNLIRVGTVYSVSFHVKSR